jgi:hypothetical protein
VTVPPSTTVVADTARLKAATVEAVVPVELLLAVLTPEFVVATGVVVVFEPQPKLKRASAIIAA